MISWVFLYWIMFVSRKIYWNVFKNHSLRSDDFFGISPVVSTNSREISTKFRQNTRIDNRKDRLAIKIFDKYRQTLESFGIINPEKYNINPEKSILFSEKIVINPKMLEYFTGMTEHSTGKIIIPPNWYRIDRISYRIDKWHLQKDTELISSRNRLFPNW